MNRFFFALPLALLLFIGLPQSAVEKMRLACIGTLFPLWKSAFQDEADQERQMHNLQLENYQLRSQIDLVYQWLANEKKIQGQADMLHALQLQIKSETLFRRENAMRSLLQQMAMAAPARIIYRDPSSWSSSCWIDVGENNNRSLGQQIIAKNSPVVLGNSLIGIVEFVGEKQSRVRFITDSGLKTAVRAVRGSVMERDLGLGIANVLDLLRKNAFHKDAQLIQDLNQLQNSLSVRFEDGYFAKGEVVGSSAIYQRSLNQELKGIGFNCDIADVEGGMRDLRDRSTLKEGDLLVTSGLDGVFPAGLHVAYVTKIEPVREGDYYLQLKAKPAASSLFDITSVFVLPPLTTE